MRALLLLLLILMVSIASLADDSKAKPLTVLAYGDSLTAGYGLGPKDGFSPQLQAWLNEKLNQSVKVVNAGVSGDTSTSGRARLDWTMKGLSDGKADLVIIELGGNDVLRLIKPDITRKNIEAIIIFFQGKGIKILLTGMRSPPSYGPEYQKSFDTIYSDLAKKYNVLLYPFFLEGVAMDPALNQDDGIHPTKQGIAIIVNKLGPYVIPLLNE